MATDTEQLVLSISADTAQIKRALTRLQGDAKTTAKSVETSFNSMNVQPMAQRTSQSMRAMQADAKNLTFQLNDITQGLLGGQSPFQVMIQQGSQVSQVLTGAGGITNAVKLLGSSFVGLLNPISLATSAVIFALGYAVQYFTATEDGAKESEAALKKEQAAIDAAVDKWQELLPTLKAIRDARREAIESEQVRLGTEQEIQRQFKDLRAQAEAMIPSFSAVRAELFELGASTKDTDAAMLALLEGMKAGNPDVEDLDAMLKILNTTLKDSTRPEVAQLRKNLEDLRAPMAQQVEATKRMREEATLASEKQKVFNEALEDLRKVAKGHLSDAEKLIELYNEAIRAMGQLDDKQRELMERRLLPDFLAAQAAQVVGGPTAEFIKREEAGGGFTPKAYWDVNAYRVGYGSDTYVDAMNRVQKVTKDTVVTLEQANADLARRIPEFQATIQRQIGPEFWQSFTEDQQTALTSIAYNYGSLPDSIVRAIQAGDKGKVAVAIANLSANPERRQREARLFAGGGGSIGDALKVSEEAARAAEKEAEARATATQNLAEYLEKLDEQATLEQRITEIKTSGLSAEEQARAIAVETELQTALNLAKQNGLTLTEREIEQIRAATLAKTDAKIAGDAYVKSQKDSADAIKQFNQQVASMAQSAISGLVNDLRNGVEAGEAFNNMLNRIIDSLIQMALQSLFKPGGGLLGGLFGVAHSGGIVGQTAFPQRQVSPLVFAGAPRFASGGMVGLRSGEVPIIAHRGEMIIPKNMVGRGGNSSVTNNLGNISIDMSGTGLVSAGPQQAKEFGMQIQKLVEVQMVRESRPGGLLRRVPG